MARMYLNYIAEDDFELFPFSTSRMLVLQPCNIPHVVYMVLC